MLPHLHRISRKKNVYNTHMRMCLIVCSVYPVWKSFNFHACSDENDELMNRLINHACPPTGGEVTFEQ